MGSSEEKIEAAASGGGGEGVSQANILEEMKMLQEIQDQSGTRKSMNSELWFACAGPLVSLPLVGSLAYYFPQGHSEQVAVSTKRSATSQIPNYPNLPSQLLCQVHNVTLHADKDTDEIYAQMSLQPINSEKDVFPIPDFGLKSNNHPTEFFCKTLTASDTSTHGGFSVPRRAAEKLFPPLDFTMQPPTQELVVRDLHDNTWTFRHIYRGQPKRHLLTTGWSLFVGSKRLKTGDSVLFIRDDKSQLLVGVRRANRQLTTLPSSVLSADSMHIGVLAAAAHAAANRTAFTIFYNPRACPSEFVIPLSKYRKAIYGTQLTVGMRFGMMFETEESGKRRYMGTIVGIGDLDPLRWPGSKWRNLQVEWDEPGCSDKHKRVSPWEIETPESLFIFPSLTSGLKRVLPAGFIGGDAGWGNLIKRQLNWAPQGGNGDAPCSPVSSLCSEQLLRMLLKPQVFNCPAIRPPVSQELCPTSGAPLEDVKTTQELNQINHVSQPEVVPLENQSCLKASATGKLDPVIKIEDQNLAATTVGKANLEPEHSMKDTLGHSTLAGECNGEKSLSFPTNPQVSVNQMVQSLNIQSQNPSHMQMHANICPSQPLLESSVNPRQQTHLPLSDSHILNGSYRYLNNNTGEWLAQTPAYVPLSGIHRPPPPSPTFGLQDLPAVFPDPAISMNQDIWDQQMNNMRFLSQPGELAPLSQQYPCSINTFGAKDLSDESNNQSGIYNSLNIDISNGGDAVVDPSVSSAILEEFCTSKNHDIQNNPGSDCFVGNFSSSQDVQSQITCASLADAQAFSQQDLPDSSGGTSCSNVDFEKTNLLQNNSLQQLVPQRVRTYTKVQKAGSVGRSIDVSSYKNYEELCSAIELMFGLEGLLNNPRGTGWKLVYVDYENDVLLMGDDPWKEFVGCVRCIRILSPSEVQQMSEEGMKLLNNASLQGISGLPAETTHN